MIGKIILVVFLIVLLGFSSWFLYQNLPGKPEHLELVTESGKTETPRVIKYSETPMFYSDMRFNHNDISYFIEPSCSEEREDKMERAFSILHEKIEIISFYPSIKSEADILVGCSEDYLQQSEELFIAGEGGPTSIINTSLYNIILEGKMWLYKEKECAEPIVELHELLHVFGFDHSNDPENIMYNFSSCDQEISQDVINNLILSYSQEALSDLFISEINATKKGRYLDFYVEVRNRGIAETANTSIVLLADNRQIDSFSIEEMDIGEGKRLQVTNLKLPSRSTEKIKFVVDSENLVRELYENNNEIELSVK